MFVARENVLFSQVPVADVPRSTFDRSHTHKTTFNAGNLIPIYVDEALPGDTFDVRLTAFARIATLIYPIMDNVYLDFHFFAVPNRLLWSNWKKFMGERLNPSDSIDYLIPQIEAPATTGWGVGSLGDYFGLPTGTAGTPVVNALPFRAYNQIWNEWYRDQNLQTRATEVTGDGPELAANTAANYPIRKRGKRHDYFTSCLPWPQKGNDVTIPLGSQAPVNTNGTAPTFTNSATVNQPLSAGFVAGGTGVLRAVSINQSAAGSTAQISLAFGANTGLYADLTAATAATINSLRFAFQTQKMLERDARGGTRYIELIKAHFGVTSPDARQQRPEYLGGGTLPLNVNPVAQTSATGVTGSTRPGADLYGFGTAAGSNIGFVKSFTEHCTLIGLVSARADLTYYQGIFKPWLRRNRYDYYWPEFAHLGEQVVQNKELYFANIPVTDDLPFGYQERWAEYRYFPNRVTGRFRPFASGGDYKEWHLAQTFGSTPSLGDTFIQETPPMSRIKAVSTADDFLFDSHIRIKCTRPMPVFSVPGYLDHF